jgi:hypothetical protein
LRRIARDDLLRGNVVPLPEERDVETLRQIGLLLERENHRLLAANVELRAELARLRGEPAVEQLAFTVEAPPPAPSATAAPPPARSRAPGTGTARASNLRCRSSRRSTRCPSTGATARRAAAPSRK